MFDTDAIKLMQDKLTTNLIGFVPELLVCIGIVTMLLLRLLPRFRLHMGWVAIGFSTLALLLAMSQFFEFKIGGYSLRLHDRVGGEEGAFDGLLQLDQLTDFLRILLLSFAVLLSWLSMLTGIPDEEDSADFFTLVMGATLGMMLMASANHLLMVFIAVEMASLPSYALAGFLKGRRLSSEAALKYVVYGGGASGVMLYGMSLVAGRYGTGYLRSLSQAIQTQMTEGTAGTLLGLDTVVLLGLVFILVGLAFKLSAVPFHFWAPDVFEGAAAEVGAFLSVASKSAALALTARLLLMLTTNLSDQMPLLALQRTIAPIIVFFAALTATFGNLAAYPQTNLKRLLAYSTIAHAGYMLMGLATVSHAGARAVLFYMVAYVPMNLGAFAVVAFLRNAIGSEDLRDMRGLVYRSPWAVALLGVFLLSLLGLPPLVGFAAKFQIFAALFDAGKEHTTLAQAAGETPTLGYLLYALLIIGGINTVISAVYYLRVMKVMILDQPVEELEGQPAPSLRLSPGALVYAGLLGLFVFLGGVAWNPIATASDRGVSDFEPSPTQPFDPNLQPVAGAGPGGGGGGGRGNRPGGARPGGARPGGARPGGQQGQPPGGGPARPEERRP